MAAFVAAGAAAVLVSAPLAGQGGAPGTASEESIKAFIASRMAKTFVPPRTPWGDPDISGVFTTKDEANTPLERPDEWSGRTMDDITPREFAEALARRQQAAVERAPFAGGGEPDAGIAIAVPIHWFDNLAARNSRPWFIIDPADGRIPPMKPQAAKHASVYGRLFNDARAETYTDRYLGDRCIVVSGIAPIPSSYGNSFQILQTPDHVIVRYEMVHEARVIPLDGRPHADRKARTYFGDARGRWDGNTLVVDTANFHPDLSLYSHRGIPAGNLHLIERFTRIAPNTVEWTFTFDDGSVWDRPWTYSVPMTEDNAQVIHEYACHEGNYGMANLLSAARAADKKATAGPSR